MCPVLDDRDGHASVGYQTQKVGLFFLAAESFLVPNLRILYKCSLFAHWMHCGPLQQAKGRDNEKMLVRDLLSPRGVYSRKEGTPKKPISPLVGAAFSSNWKLFREVYQKYEEWTGHRWYRNNVRA